MTSREISKVEHHQEDPASTCNLLPSFQGETIQSEDVGRELSGDVTLVSAASIGKGTAEKAGTILKETLPFSRFEGTSPPFYHSRGKMEIPLLK